jgi:hypothetical protein
MPLQDFLGRPATACVNRIGSAQGREEGFQGGGGVVG